MSDQVFGDLVVVELATGVAGPYAGKLLADFGADVIKVEPPGGDPVRHRVVVAGDAPEPERSPHFLHLNTNKRSIVADLATPDGVDLVRCLVANADVVIESETPGRLDALGLGYDDLRAINPRVVLASVTPFGQTGPYAQWVGEEIVSYAMGGPMLATGSSDHEPVKLAGDIVGYQCGNMAAVSIVAALATRAIDGQSVHVDISNFETQAGSIDRQGAYLVNRVFTGRDAPREGGSRIGLVPAGIYPTNDGYVQVLAAPDWIPRMCRMIERPDLAGVFESGEWLDSPDTAVEMHESLLLWTISRSRREATDRGQEEKAGVMAVNLPIDVLSEPHFNERGFWATAEHPVAGRLRQPGAPFAMPDGWELRRPAPLLDQHRDEILESLSETSAPTETSATTAAADAAGTTTSTSRPVGADRALPLNGIRVLDLSVVWAGPYGTMLLSDLGAEVIRIDNPLRFPTATRGAIVRPPDDPSALGPIWGGFPENVGGDRPWNRVAGFVPHARNKLGATLDLRTDLGRDVFLRLVAESDVLIENNSAQVLDKLGLGWGDLRAANPAMVAVRMPSLGLSGPASGYIGFGAHIEALCGLTAMRGYLDLDLTENPGTYHMDPASGTVAAFAAMAGLRRRDQTGEGCLIELAQAENLIQHIGEFMIDAELTGRSHARTGNRHATHAPQGCYPADGDDCWVALSVTSDESWRALRRAMGQPDWASDPRFDRSAGRHAHHEEIDGHLGLWTAQRTALETAELCQAAGVPAGPVHGQGDLLADPHLRDRMFFRHNGSAQVGTYEFTNHLWKWDGPTMEWNPLNTMGDDNDYVLRTVAGINDDEWDELLLSHQISRDFLSPDGTPS